jgi:hypothetical protein
LSRERGLELTHRLRQDNELAVLISGRLVIAITADRPRPLTVD